MGAIFIFEFILKAVMLTLGVLAWHGMKWAFVAFVILLAVVLLADILLAVVFFINAVKTQKSWPI